jgi:hypothetical protein
MIPAGWAFQEKAKIDEYFTHDFNKFILNSGMKGE